MRRTREENKRALTELARRCSSTTRPATPPRGSVGEPEADLIDRGLGKELIPEDTLDNTKFHNTDKLFQQDLPRRQGACGEAKGRPQQHHRFEREEVDNREEVDKKATETVTGLSTEQQKYIQTLQVERDRTLTELMEAPEHNKTVPNIKRRVGELEAGHTHRGLRGEPK